MHFFAKGIRIVKSNEGSNNGRGNPGTSEANVPADLEVATHYGVAAGQPVLVVPAEMILTGTKAREELGPILVAEESLKEDLPSFYLMVKILKECERGTSSMIYDWLNSLPWWFCNGSSLSEPCWELVPEPLARLIQQEHTRFQLFAKSLEDATCLSDRIRNDQALVHWAFCIVSTRSIPLNSLQLNYTDAQLIPNVDMFNHAHPSQASIQLEIDPDTGNCLAVATRNVPAGNPLRMTYDNSDPSFLLTRYGFVDELSPVVPCFFYIEHPTEEISKVGYDPSRMVFFKETGDVSQEVWDVLLYHLVLNNQTNDKIRLRHQQALLEAVVNGNDSAKMKIHTTYYAETVQALQSHVETLLIKLQGFLDKAKIDATNNQNPRLFFVTRHNLCLKQVFSRVHERLLSQKSSPTSPVDDAQQVWGLLQKY